MATCVLVRDYRYRIGGYESWVDSLASRLPDFGIEVIVLVPRTFGAQQFIQKLKKARIVWVDASTDPVEQAGSLIEGLAEIAQEGVSGVFLSLSYPYVNVASINLASSPWLSVPVMHGSHSSVFEWMFADTPRAVIAPSKRLTEFCASEARSRVGLIRSMGMVRCIPHGVPLVPDLLTRRVPHVKGGVLRIAVASRLDPLAKRPMEYIDIAHALHRRGIEFAMTLAGDGPLYEEIQSRVVSQGLLDQVKLLGAVPRERVQGMLLSADVFLSTSESEAFGLSIAEALAAGCAVVSADIGGEVAKLVNGQTGFRVPIGDIPAYVECLARFADTPARALPMGIAGRRLIETEYSEELMLGRYAKLIRKLASSAKPDRHWRGPKILRVSPADAQMKGVLENLGIPVWMRGALRKLWRTTGL